ncbi:protein hedgehog-like [Salminus brasiliensis]|uniref:protein hedgehog-like n=1 Tax=Salminus brasiliensis TaxID=930266 RepID=UPI003B833966
MIKLDTSGREYVGKAEVNQGDGWEKICIKDIPAAKSFCGMVFPSQKWTVSLPQSHAKFHAMHTYQCDNGYCSLEKKPQLCNMQIQCRATCNPYQIPNGVACGFALEGERCSVSCNRLYNLQGSSEIQCRSDDWSGWPYCVESGECGDDHERGPHSVGCLTKLWTEVGCSVDADRSPTKGHWTDMDFYTVGFVRSMMARLPDHSGVTYNPDCQVDECFPGQATVLTSEWNRKLMSELRVGDKVLALDTHGDLVFSEVILWLDRRPNAKERYILLTTEGYSDPLSLSADHVTFIASSNGTVASVATMIPVFAKDLRPGHLIHRYDAANGSLVARRVTDVRESIELGAYAPLTVEGNLIVDGHLVSCYALQCRQYLAHLPFAPYRFLHTLRSYVPLFKDVFPVKQEQEDEGVHWYASAWHQVGKWFDYPFGKTCYPRELRLYHYP